MKIVLIAGHFPPLRTSSAVMLRALAGELVSQGHEVLVVAPHAGLDKPFLVEVADGFEILRIAAPGILDVGHVRQGFRECLLPFAMIRGIRKSRFRTSRWEGVIWYSPSIFLGPVAGMLRRRSACRSYLVLRDLLSEMLVDLGVIRRGLIYRVLQLVERYQYSVADTIGVQAESDLGYFARRAGEAGRRVELLRNWIAPARNRASSLVIADTPLSGRTVLVYAGNIGIAQGVDIILDIAEALQHRTDVGFLFVGRGNAFARLADTATRRQLSNVLFHPEIDPEEIPGLLAQCDIGLVTLDPRHTTHNVPGKFLAYVQAGLPVLARLNPGNDLARLIEDEGVGWAYAGNSREAFQHMIVTLADDASQRAAMGSRGPALARRLFSSSAAARQIVASLGGAGSGPDEG